MAAFKKQCELGEKADSALAEGRFGAALDGYHKVLSAMDRDGTIDGFVASKATLGLLLCQLQTNRVRDAHQIWLSEMTDGVLGIGIYGLEHAQTSVHDVMVYYFVCAYLHSLSDDDSDVAAKAVNHYMKIVGTYALEKNRDLMPAVLSNWRLHLTEIFSGEVPVAFSAEVDAMDQEYGDAVVALAELIFPQPAPWSIDWAGPEDRVTVFHPDGRVEYVSPDELEGNGKNT